MVFSVLVGLAATLVWKDELEECFLVMGKFAKSVVIACVISVLTFNVWIAGAAAKMCSHRRFGSASVPSMRGEIEKPDDEQLVYSNGSCQSSPMDSEAMSLAPALHGDQEGSRNVQNLHSHTLVHEDITDPLPDSLVELLECAWRALEVEVDPICSPRRYELQPSWLKCVPCAPSQVFRVAMAI